MSIFNKPYGITARNFINMFAINSCFPICQTTIFENAPKFFMEAGEGVSEVVGENGDNNEQKINILRKIFLSKKQTVGNNLIMYL